MDETQACVIRELSPELLTDYLRFFDQDAFADNPRWASCYCHFNHAPHHLKNWEARTVDENRAAVSQLIRDRRMHGYLAYLGGTPMGRCLSPTMLACLNCERHSWRGQRYAKSPPEAAIR